MAYNLQSLVTILEQILNPQQTRWIVDHNKSQLQSLLEKSVHLKQILENSSLTTKIESLESQIRDAAHEAEDLIESHMVDQMLSDPGGMSFTFTTPDLRQVMQQLDSVMEQVLKLKEGMTASSGPSSSAAASASHNVSSKTVVVGLDEALLQLKDRVMGLQSNLEIVPIVGMGGIGKTTLARKLYQDPSIVEHFTCLAWITVSQDFDMRAILLGLLGCIIGKEVGQHVAEEIHPLKDILYQSLYGRTYIIVLDDVWSATVWDEIRMYFPDTNNRSRIVITTRESDVVKHVNSQNKPHEMHLLNESESWDLLRQEVFGDQEDCPASLERIGRNIASNCGGLPLAIHVVGGLLSKANTTWMNVANDVRAAVAESGEQFSNILSLSYNHLPSHLRPCFLYMGAFPEDYEIKASRLTKLWVAEGFLKPNGEKSLEEEAEDCLKALVERNLVSVRSLKSNGRPKRCGMHDLMRDLCLKKAEEQRFVHVGNKYTGEVKEESMYSIRRVSVHRSYHVGHIHVLAEHFSTARSFLCMALPLHFFLSPLFLGLRLLRVLDVFEMVFQVFPTEILHIVNLRYLAFSCDYCEVPFAISELYNLQTLVIRASFIYLPCEIVQMAELRHLMVYRGSVVVYGSDWGGFILDKLQTALSIGLESSSSHEFLHRIPNVKKLGIKDESCNIDLYHLSKLETFIFSRSASGPPLISPPTLRLPLSLKNLYLTSCKIDGGFMNYLCALPNLEVLKLKFCKFEGEEWDATEQEFCTLKFMLLERAELVDWRADETNFPRLRHLVIRDCLDLDEIPSGIGEIPTLQTIELGKASRPSLVASAELIVEEQRDNGNEELQLQLLV